ncbi:ABC transporter [Candidatus Magnetoovum chiemensis]|nr:ABC transporter [Candidatus Magnetoovum chiemensis]
MPFDIIKDLLFDYTLRTVALGSCVLGIVSGVLGVFAVLKKQSLLGDVVSHAALPGIAVAFLLTGTKTPLTLLLGAFIAGLAAAVNMLAIVRFTRIKEDSALGLVLSVFFGLGLVLLTLIQKRPDATQAGLETYLFGQAATLMQRDVIIMAVVGFFIFLIVLLFWKEFKILTFDPDFALTSGYPVKLLDLLLTALLVIAIVLGLQTVGVVLMSSMLIAPASAARQWTNRLGVMVFISACFGAFGGVSGAVVSAAMAKMPTGPTIIICLSFIFLISLLFAPSRGLAGNYYRMFKNRNVLDIESLLFVLGSLKAHHEDICHGHSALVLKARWNKKKGSLINALGQLKAKGWAQEVCPGKWAITEQGLNEYRRFFNSKEE